MAIDLKNLTEFKEALKDAGSRVLCVMFHNGCRVEEKDFDSMRSAFGARVYMAKVNTLNAEDIKKKYADGSAKPFFKAYKGGKLVNMIKYADWEGNKG